LESLLRSEFAEAIQQKSNLADLRTELERAEIVESVDVPADVITMESTVRLRDLDTGERETYTLVYPDQANIADNKLSILAPIGIGILGYRVGDVVRWRVPSGRRRLRVEEVVYQPERERVREPQRSSATVRSGAPVTCPHPSR
jgi:regulator of nucleoside diphosphate kinase